MSAAYLALGVIGYWSRGGGVDEIIIFAMGTDAWSRVAAGAILFQVPLSEILQRPRCRPRLPCLARRPRGWSSSLPGMVSPGGNDPWRSLALARAGTCGGAESLGKASLGWGATCDVRLAC